MKIGGLLSKKHAETLYEALCGKTRKEISYDFNIPQRTLESRFAAIRRVTGTRCDKELAIFALAAGWATLDELVRSLPREARLEIEHIRKVDACESAST